MWEKERNYIPAERRADISPLKSKRLLGTTEVEPRDRVRVKIVEGSVIETHGNNETKIL
jgi:hypothetical protein